MKGKHPHRPGRSLPFSSRNTFLARVTYGFSGLQFLCEETGALASYAETI